jgi:hypothetical protein
MGPIVKSSTNLTACQTCSHNGSQLGLWATKGQPLRIVVHNAAWGGSWPGAIVIEEGENEPEEETCSGFESVRS